MVREPIAESGPRSDRRQRERVRCPSCRVPRFEPSSVRQRYRLDHVLSRDDGYQALFRLLAAARAHVLPEAIRLDMPAGALAELLSARPSRAWSRRTRSTAWGIGAGVGPPRPPAWLCQSTHAGRCKCRSCGLATIVNRIQ